MNLVGEKGRGESVWLAFFLRDVLLQFAVLAGKRGDEATQVLCDTHAESLRSSILAHAWDGQWYLRAFFDDGQSLGSADGGECQIDSLPQSWAAMTATGEPERRRLAMAAVDARLVRRDIGIIQLFDPPFDKSGLNPGYVAGYVPGVRENGGQYTHAAIWSVMAFAAMGDSAKAWELFQLISPPGHGGTSSAIETYKVEPYVVAADVYANPQHAGRGGWTWYTGSAGWMYRLITESLLGLRLHGNQLLFSPCIPAEWRGYIVRYRYHNTTYTITFHNPEGGNTVHEVFVDGMPMPMPDGAVHLTNDQRPHCVEVHLTGS
jgi:cyclic beta-1,2-glucan synthetase